MNDKLSMKKRVLQAGLLCTAFVLHQEVGADWTDARCDIYPKGQDQASAVLPCVFSQTQGHIVIQRSDGVTYDLLPQDDDPNHYRNAGGKDIYRELMGEEGMIFRFPDESVFVYWNTAGLPGKNLADDATRPFSTRTFDATARIACSLKGRSGPARKTDCAAGVIRSPGEGGAIVVVMRPDGFVRVLQVAGGSVVRHGRGHLKETWQSDQLNIVIDGSESYVLPGAFIGGD
ncbi:hypothetical protein [Thiolapillus sp.]